MYCPRCKILTDETKCPDCRKRTREVTAEDPVLLTVKPQPLAEMLSDVLKQNDIPSMLMGSLGAGLSAVLGANIEQTKVYIAYSDLIKAEELADELFGADGTEEKSFEEDESET